MIVFILYCALCLNCIVEIDGRIIIDKYKVARSKLIEEEFNKTLGARLNMNEEETLANQILTHLKLTELEKLSNYETFNFTKHFLDYKEYTNNSKVYQIVKAMPKGAALHVHSTFMLDADDLMELTYEDNLYVCYNNSVKFVFSSDNPASDSSCFLLRDMRVAAKDVIKFDEELKKNFLLDNGLFKERSEKGINYTWDAFNRLYLTIKSLISYRPVREKYIYKTLKSFYDDNVMYIEIRSGLSPLYELNGTVHDKMYVAKLYKDTVDKFKLYHPDFVGIKLIITKHRTVNVSQFQETLNFAKNVKSEMPDLFAGVDLVGQEDLGKPLLNFLPQLAEMKGEIDYYFHAGETNWYGTPTDENLFDSILLGAKRIGHAYSLLKHPSLTQAIYLNDIGLEVNLISNTVLSLVRDVRNHPLAMFLALGMPVVLSSDDPGAWGADPLSHDFYVAFVGVANVHADLRMLKQLALNSIKYSAMNKEEKLHMCRIFTKRWTIFIKNLIANYNNCS